VFIDWSHQTEPPERRGGKGIAREQLTPKALSGLDSEIPRIPGQKINEGMENLNANAIIGRFATTNRRF
jgi:hypothetical protein